MYTLYIALAATILVPAGIGITHIRELKPGLLAFAVLLFAGAVNEIVMISLAGFGIHNLFMLHGYAVAELVLLAVFYYHAIRNRLVRQFIIGGVIAVAGAAVAWAVPGHNLYDFNSVPRALESVFVGGLAVIYFYEIATTGDGRDPFLDGCFFINGGILFYFSSSFIIFAFSQYVGGDHLFLMWAVHAYVNAFCNLVYAYGLWIRTSSRSFSSVR